MLMFHKILTSRRVLERGTTDNTGQNRPDLPEVKAFLLSFRAVAYGHSSRLPP